MIKHNYRISKESSCIKWLRFYYCGVFPTHPPIMTSSIVTLIKSRLWTWNSEQEINTFVQRGNTAIHEGRGVSAWSKEILAGYVIENPVKEVVLEFTRSLCMEKREQVNLLQLREREFGQESEFRNWISLHVHVIFRYEL